MNEGLLEQTEAEQTTGEFKKAYEYEKERWEAEFYDGDYYTLSDVMESLNNLKSSHNADMAAQIKENDVAIQLMADGNSLRDQRIAELMKEIADWSMKYEEIEAHQEEKGTRIAQLKWMLDVADEANKNLRNDVLVRESLNSKYRSQLAQRSGLVPADKAVR